MNKKILFTPHLIILRTFTKVFGRGVIEKLQRMPHLSGRGAVFIVFCYLLSTICCLPSTIFAVERAVVSVIFSSDIKPYRQSLEGFVKFLKEKGVALLVSEYNLKKEKPDIIYSQINSKKPDIILAVGTDATKLAKEKIKDIPVIFSVVVDPQAVTGLNVTGVSMDIPVDMKLQKVVQVIPNLKRIGMIYSPKLTSQYNEISQVCKNSGFHLTGKKINTHKEFPDTLKELSWQIDCFLMIPDPNIYFMQSIEHLLLESLRNKFPVIGLSSFYTKAGAIISFDCDYEDSGRQAGELVLRILKGENPASIQIAKPRKIKFSLNLIAAEKLNIKIPQHIIKEASEVFE